MPQRAVDPAGGEIVRLRTERGWPAARLAAEAGIPLKSLQHYEHGRRCKLTVLWRIANALSDDKRTITAPDITAPPAEDRISA